MKASMNSIFTRALLAVSLLSVQLLGTIDSADARGGGGGGGRGGGGFGGGGFGGIRGGFGEGGFGRGDFGRGDMNRGAWDGAGDRGGFADGDRGFGGQNRGDFANRPAVSENDLRQGANQEYHWSSLPTDGGFSRASERGAGNLSRVTSNISPAGLANRGLAVRNAFNRYDLFDRNFWNRYPYGWYYPGWGAYWGWGNTGWSDLCAYWNDPDCGNEPVEYDYGNNITYQDNSVYYGNQAMATADDYYNQAQTLALSAPPTVPTSVSVSATVSGTKTGTKAVASTKSGAKTKASKEKESDWKPLGVFALTQGDQTDANSIVQLAVNKSGIIRGNYFNPLTQDEKPIQGKVDMKNKRVAWTVGTNKTVVYDTGLANLLAQQSTLLIHMDKNSTQQWNLIRLQQNQS